MWEDPIVAQVHRVRREIFARFDYDLEGYFQHLSELAEEERARGRVVISVPPPKRQWSNPDAA